MIITSDLDDPTASYLDMINLLKRRHEAYTKMMNIWNNRKVDDMERESIENMIFSSNPEHLTVAESLIGEFARTRIPSLVNRLQYSEYKKVLRKSLSKLSKT